MSKSLMILVLSTLTVAAAQARPGSDPPRNPHHPTLSAPEIDPASTLSGLTMLAGGLAVIRGRGNKK